jgi:gluconolactonase
LVRTSGCEGQRLSDAHPQDEPKPLRVFLQDGSNDLNIYGGNWFLANQEMLSAFEFAGYDVEHAWGDGGHDGKHGGSILPDALRWLWRGYPAPLTFQPPIKPPTPRL